MNAIEALKPCPFCGGEAEMDSQRSFRMLGSGNIGSVVAIYCLQCSADMTLCHADHPGVEIDALCAELREQWNRRPREALSTPPSDANALRERVARKIFEDSIRGLINCCPWDGSTLDDAHPGARERWFRYADSAIAALARPSSAGEKDGTGDGDIVGRLLAEIEARVRPTVCPTWSSAEGSRQEGRISEADLDTVQLLAEKYRTAAALIEEQRKALAKLVNEVNGLEWRQGQVIEVIGQTNWSVLQEAANRARHLTAP